MTDPILSGIRKLIIDISRTRTESEVEGLVCSFFRDSLGWKDRQIERQHQVDTGKIDVLLQDNKKRSFPLEIKRPEDFSNRSQKHYALKQLSKYLTTINSNYGIVTDGKEWIFAYMSLDNRQIHKVHYINTVKNNKLNSERIIRCIATFNLMRPDNIYKLFNAFSAIHASMDVDEFEKIMNHNKKTRVDELMNRYDDTIGKKHDPEISKLISNIYTGGLSPVRYIYKLDMFKPIPL